MTSLADPDLPSALYHVIGISRSMIDDRFHWSGLHLSIVRHYFSGLYAWCHLRELPSLKLFNDMNHHKVPRSPNFDAELVASFCKDLQQFFMVPRLKKFATDEYGIKKYKAVEVFISFLLQLLHNKIDSIDPLKEGIENLEKELRFLRTVLGDASLKLCDEHEKVNNLLEEFEVVANEAGSLVHSLLFSTDPVSRKMDEGLGIIFKHIDLLKANIMKFVDLRLLNSRAMTPKTSALDSLLIVDSLLYDLEVLIKREDNQIADVKDQIKTLHHRLVILQSSIKDTGAPQPSEIGELRELLMRIGDIACEAEYLIISFLVGDAPPTYLIIRLTDAIHKIELIGAELQEIRMKCEIGQVKFAKHFSVQLPLQAKRNSKVDDITVGLEEKEMHILDQLLGGLKRLQIISIIGMPGLGKTTLAKKLYNHPSISDKFDRCSFCVISQSYEKKSLLLDLLINPTSEMSEMEEVSLEEDLYKNLKGRRYLIVMDDIWESNVWNDLRRCFPDDENGSRILITSRNKGVAPPNATIFELLPLKNDECWVLLEKKVFHDEPCPHELLKIGKKIAADCHGVPLAVVAVAGVLSSMDKEESQWKKVEENLASFIFDARENTVVQILGLSYKHLPEHLKWCFLYSGVFSEDKEIPVQKLMRLWIAEGFIIMHEEQKNSAESVAEEYLMELIDKNLVIISKRRSDGGVKACIIHDLFRDLCLRKCEEENFLKFANWSTSKIVLSKSHRLRLEGDDHLSIFENRQDLRSFHAAFPLSIYTSNMKLVRVLSFNRMFYGDCRFLYSRIEFLVCLRYLCVAELPASIGSLVNLEFLVVNTIVYGVRIPRAILKMMKLRYLHVFSDATYHADSNSSQTNNLEFLSTVNIYSLMDEEMLKSSPHLRKLKCNCKALWDEERKAYRYPDLLFLTQLESLKMSFRDERVTAEIIFPPYIKKLTLSNFYLPWEKMTTAVGRLPKLEALKLVDGGRETETWETRDGEFQQLRFLKLSFAGISQWNVASSEHFPRLQQLVLINCYDLQKIPSEIGEIATLQLIEIQKQCPKSLVESAEDILQEQREMGNEELRVIIKEVHHLED